MVAMADEDQAMATATATAVPGGGQNDTNTNTNTNTSTGDGNTDNADSGMVSDISLSDHDRDHDVESRSSSGGSGSSRSSRSTRSSFSRSGSSSSSDVEMAGSGVGGGEGSRGRGSAAAGAAVIDVRSRKRPSDGLGGISTTTASGTTGTSPSAGTRSTGRSKYSSDSRHTSWKLPPRPSPATSASAVAAAAAATGISSSSGQAMKARHGDDATNESDNNEGIDDNTGNNDGGVEETEAPAAEEDISQPRTATSIDNHHDPMSLTSSSRDEDGSYSRGTTTTSSGAGGAYSSSGHGQASYGLGSSGTSSGAAPGAGAGAATAGRGRASAHHLSQHHHQQHYYSQAQHHSQAHSQAQPAPQNYLNPSEWLRLRPRANRHSRSSVAYAQHAQHSHQDHHHDDSITGARAGTGAGAGATGDGGGAHHHRGHAVHANSLRAFNPRQILFPPNMEPIVDATFGANNPNFVRIQDSRHETVERPVWSSVGPELQQQYAIHGEQIVVDDCDNHDDDVLAKAVEEGAREAQNATADEEEEEDEPAVAEAEVVPVAADEDGAIVSGATDPRQQYDISNGLASSSPFQSDVSALTDALSQLTDTETELSEAEMNGMSPAERQKQRALLYAQQYTALVAQTQAATSSGQGVPVTLPYVPQQLQHQHSHPHLLHPQASAAGAQLQQQQLYAMQNPDVDAQEQQLLAYQQAQAAYQLQRAQYEAYLMAQQQAAQAQAQAQAQMMKAQAEAQIQAQVNAQIQVPDEAATSTLDEAGLGAEEEGQLQLTGEVHAEETDQPEMHLQQPAADNRSADQEQQEMKRQQQQEAVDSTIEAVDVVPTSLHRSHAGAGTVTLSGSTVADRTIVSSAAFSSQPTIQARGDGGRGMDTAIEEGEEEGSYCTSTDSRFKEEGDGGGTNSSRRPVMPRGDEVDANAIEFGHRQHSDGILQRSSYGSAGYHERSYYTNHDMSGPAGGSHSAGVFHIASPDSKYETYACRVDVTQGDRSAEISLFSGARPHMRGFHFAWMGFFCAFLAWFAIAPLLPEIAWTLDLSRDQIWNSSICSVAAGVVFRVLAGPLSDKYGARWVMFFILVVAGIPCMCTGFVNSGPGLSVLRTVIGIGGATFVPMQYWTSSMFTREVAGTANSLAAGWGNLGGGITQILIGSILFPLFKLIYGETDPNEPAEKAWRTVCVVPGFFCIVCAWGIVRYSDDCPKGNYRKRERLGLMPSVSAEKSLKAAVMDRNTWLLIVQYACCFGVELTMSNAAVLYFTEEFGLPIERASAIASIFGWMNLFARGLGGFTSDMMNASRGMRGRLIFQSISLACQGGFVVVFGFTRSLGGAVATMVVFSLFVQSSEGAIYAVIPYVRPPVTGSVAGLVGAGGNFGGVVFSVIFRYYENRLAFILMGVIAAASSLLSPLIQIKDHSAIFCNCADKKRKMDQVVRRISNMSGTSSGRRFSQNLDEDMEDKSSKPDCEELEQGTSSSEGRHSSDSTKPNSKHDLSAHANEAEGKSEGEGQPLPRNQNTTTSS